MKQSITKKQWNEINPEKQMEFIIGLGEKPKQITEDYGEYQKKEEVHPSYLTLIKEVRDFRPNNGQMIEFLGDVLDSIENMHGSYVIYDNAPVDREQYEEKELCDALWELCKIKLKEEIKK